MAETGLTEVSEVAETAETQVEDTAPEINPADIVNQVLAAKNSTPEVAPKVDEKKEVLPEVSPESKVEDSKLAQKFAALSKREKALREREKAIELKEKAAATPKVEAVPEKAPLKLRMKQDPFNTMKEEFGLDLEALTAIAKNEGKLTGEMQLKLKQEELESTWSAKLEALEKKLAEKEESEKTLKQQEAEQRAYTEFKGHIADHIKGSPAEYELLGLEEDAAQVVYDVISAHYEATKGEDGVGRILSTKEAADHVENHLLDEAKKYTSLSKIKGLFQSQDPAKVAEKVETASTKVKTLSNEQTGSAPPATKKRPLTRDEEIAEAMKLIKFNN